MESDHKTATQGIGFASLAMPLRAANVLFILAGFFLSPILLFCRVSAQVVANTRSDPAMRISSQEEKLCLKAIQQIPS